MSQDTDPDTDLFSIDLTLRDYLRSLFVGSVIITSIVSIITDDLIYVLITFPIGYVFYASINKILDYISPQDTTSPDQIASEIADLVPSPDPFPIDDAALSQLMRINKKEVKTFPELDVSIKELQKKELILMEPVCTICFQDLVVEMIDDVPDDDTISLLPCCKSFSHTKHLSDWLEAKATCPYCHFTDPKPTVVEVI